MKIPLVSAAARITVREVFLSDRSPVYDVLIDGAEFYNAYNEKDAYDLCNEMRSAVRSHEAAAVRVATNANRPLWQQMNAISHRFPFDSAEARALGEAATVLQTVRPT
jgi:hypothetical protein